MERKEKKSEWKEVFREEIPRPYSSIINELEEENKKLNIKVASLEWEIKWLNYTIDKLHKEIEEQEAEWGWLFDEIDYRKRECKKLKEKVRFLEECLDRKEKLNEQYLHEIMERQSTICEQLGYSLLLIHYTIRAERI